MKAIAAKWLPPGSFAHHVAVLASGTAIGQILVVLSSPIVTRLYTPEEFGVLAVYISILGMALIIASLRYELAIPLPQEQTKAVNLLVLSLLIIPITSSFIALILLLGGTQMLTWANVSTLRAYLWLLPIGMIGMGVYQVFNYWAVRIERFNYIARTKVNQALSLIALQIALGVCKFGAAGLLLAYCASQIVGVATLASLALKNSSDIFKTVRLMHLRSVAIQYAKFPLFLAWSDLINKASQSLPPIFFTALYSSQVAGWLALGERVIGLPLGFLAQSISQVYLSEAAKLARSDPREFIRMFYKTASKLFLIGLLPCVFSLFAPFVFSIIFGAEWYHSGVYVQRLSVMFLVQFVTSPLSTTLMVIDRQDLDSLWSASRLGLILLAFWIGSLYHLSDVNLVTLYGIVMTVCYCTLFLVTSRQLKHRLRLVQDQG